MAARLSGKICFVKTMPAGFAWRAFLWRFGTGFAALDRPPDESLVMAILVK